MIGVIRLTSVLEPTIDIFQTRPLHREWKQKQDNPKQAFLWFGLTESLPGCALNSSLILRAQALLLQRQWLCTAHTASRSETGKEYHRSLQLQPDTQKKNRENDDDKKIAKEQENHGTTECNHCKLAFVIRLEVAFLLWKGDQSIETDMA